ncbi:MAG: fumarylacetoacetate hydrolase family protein [Bacteroidales bacterium]|jgi:2-keto-4-pentenoate hydratase/2-oxohepta-3-ene-1,7-dioic acid hydratase in catechol pathway|nr:fumarylacetoacetate hydrolase family protein [Bacteroidales bacterium]
MKIICIGRNYIDHAKELNNPVPIEPIFFLKPDTALIRNNQPFFYPDFSNDIHYEVEIVVKFDKVGKNIAEKFAHRYYSEIGIGIDFTARDLQNKCKEKGLPWEIAKSFDGAAPISKFIKLADIGDIKSLDFKLELNGQIVQQGNTRDMIFSVDKLIQHVSRFFTIKIGDLMFTGTPAGVGPVKIGDRLTAYIGDKKMLDFQIK